MRFLLWPFTTSQDDLMADSAWNLRVELAKYWLKKYPNDNPYFYLVLSKVPGEGANLRGDETELTGTGRVFLIENNWAYRNGILTKFFLAEEFFKKMRADPLYFELVFHNAPYMVFALEAVLGEWGACGVPQACMVDWFPIATFRGSSIVKAGEGILQALAVHYPLILHSKYCLRLAGLSGEEDERAWNFLRWGILYPPFDSEKLVERSRVDEDVPYIVFNHRWTGYTGFPHVVRGCVKAWEEGHKFKLVLMNRKWRAQVDWSRVLEKWGQNIVLCSSDREEYWRILANSDAAFGWHIGFNGWSISVLESVASGCWPITHGKFFYPEMFGKLPVEFDVGTGVVDAIKFFLDNYEWCKKKARQYSREFIEKWSWNAQIESWRKILLSVRDKLFEQDVELGKMRRELQGRDLIEFASVIGSKAYLFNSVGHKKTIVARFARLITQLKYVDAGGLYPVFVRGGVGNEGAVNQES